MSGGADAADSKKVRTSPRRRTGSFLILTAVMLSVAAGCVGFALDASRLYLNWRTLETQADAAALAAAMELDGSAAGLARARAVAREAGAQNKCAAAIEFYSELVGQWSPDGEAGAAKVRVKLLRQSMPGWVRFAVKESPREIRATAIAEQRLVKPAGAPAAFYSVTAVNAEAADFGFRLGEQYEIAAAEPMKQPFEGATASGQLAAVRVLSGAPKHREIGWAAFRLAADGGRAATFAGSYLQGSKLTGARPAGYYEAALVK